VTSIGRVGGDGGIPPVFTGPVFTGVPASGRVAGAVPPVDPALAGDTGVAEAVPVAQPTITLAGRLASGDALPAAPALAIALERATRALQGGRAHEVLAALDTVWSSQLAHDSPWYLRAAALELLARHDDAAGLLREAIAQLPSSPALLYLLGVHATVAGDDAAAQLATAHAHELHPEDPVLLVLRAAVLSRGGLPFEANALLSRAVALAPTLPVRDWFAVLARLGRVVPQATEQMPPQVAPRLPRRTPAALPRVTDDVPAEPPRDAHDTAPSRTDERDDDPSWAAPLRAPADAPTLPLGLPDAVRYGLALLDAPADAARAATRHRAPDDAMSLLAARAGLAFDVAARPGGPGLVALVLVAALAAGVADPAARGLLGGALALGAGWWVTTRLRRGRTVPAARDALASPARTIDRRVD
jgi:tetratricopeptide (TPR) repeat protein